MAHAEKTLQIINKNKANKLNPGVCSVFLILAWRSNDSNWSTYVGRENISLTCGIGVDTVSIAFAKLQSLELITIREREGSTNIIGIVEHDLKQLNEHFNPSDNPRGGVG